MRGKILALIVLCVSCAAAQGGVIYVKTDGNDANSGISWDLAKQTVQAGLNAATSGDQVWVAKGTYVECVTLTDGVALYGGFAGTETSTDQRDWRANVTVLDGNRGGSVVTTLSGALAIDGFTIRNGGGIYCVCSSPTISNNTITENSVYGGGGGICCAFSSSPTISNNTISGNSSASYGGGIYSDGQSSATISNNAIAANSAGYNYGGGGICCDGSETILNNTINANSATVGGGILSRGSGTVSNNIITANSAAAGGGIAYSGSATISNNTITRNSASSIYGGGIYYCSFSSSAISNNVVAFNSSGVYRYPYYGTPALRNNCIYNPGSYNYSELTPGVGDIQADPLFENLWGGDYHLKQESPCIEAGDNSFVRGTRDMDGTYRIQGARVDIGADEFPAGGGSGVLYAGLEAPPYVRPGREYVIWVHYDNSGSAALPLPLFYLSNPSGAAMRIGTEGRSTTTGLALLGVPPPGSVSLPPGFEGRIPITFTAPADAGAHELLHFSLSALEDQGLPVDWLAMEAVLRPEDISPTDAEWMAFWSDATAELGTTWGQVTDRVAQLLGGASVPPEQLGDLTGDLRYVLPLAGEPRSQQQDQLAWLVYDPVGDVTVTPLPLGASIECSWPTIVVTHGWNPPWRLDYTPHPGLWELGSALKGRFPGYNVLVTEWPYGATTMFPGQAGNNTTAAGQQLHQVIEDLCRSESGTDPEASFWESTTYVSHSHGNAVSAQCASEEAGRGRAVILDPADPRGGAPYSDFSGMFKGGSVSINSHSFWDATPCESPGLAGTKLLLWAPSSYEASHSGALDSLTDALKRGCNTSVLTRIFDVSTSNRGRYDGYMNRDGDFVPLDHSQCGGSVIVPTRTVGAEATSEVVLPNDPNEKVSPPGEGVDKLVSALDDMDYTIYFENAPTGTAPVQEAVITDNLSASLDWSTFEMEEIAFGSTLVTTDSGPSYTGSVNLPDLRVDITAGVNTGTGQAQWVLRAIDPLTGQPPVDAMAGFLPPDDDTHRGEGHVRFKIKPKPETTPGTVISNTASIVFDGLPAVATNAVTNTIAALAPGSVGGPMPEDGATGVAINTSLSWIPAERAASYDIYLWRDGQPKPATPDAVDWPATGYQPMAELAVGTTYRWQVVAKNPTGETPGPEWTFATALLPPVMYARSLGNGQAAGISRAIVSAAFPDSFYLEADDRSSGIRVERPAHGVAVGMRADVTGVVKTNADGERYVEATWATRNGTGWVNPIGMNHKLLGGANFLFNESTGAGQQGVLDGFGLNNIGLLITTWGKFTKTSDTTFTLDDGSGVILKCLVPTGVTLDTAWKYAAVTGISSCEKVGDDLYRLLRVRSQEDIIPLLAAP